VIDPRIVPGRDSLVAIAYVLQLMADSNLSISQLVAQIPRYQIVKTKFPCRREDAERVVEALKSHFSSEKIDTQDGIRVDFPLAWLHARPSNTEPIMRIIAEAPDRLKAEKLIGDAQAVVNAVL
jgi:phosphomannomutase